jgi:hypothetical protein
MEHGRATRRPLPVFVEPNHRGAWIMMDHARYGGAWSGNSGQKTRFPPCSSSKVFEQGTGKIFIALDAIGQLAARRREIAWQSTYCMGYTKGQTSMTSMSCVVQPNGGTRWRESYFFVTTESFLKIQGAPNGALNAGIRQGWLSHIHGQVLKRTTGPTGTLMSDNEPVRLGVFLRSKRLKTRKVNNEKKQYCETLKDSMNLLQDNSHSSMYLRVGEIMGALSVIRFDGSTTNPTGF